VSRLDIPTPRNRAWGACTGTCVLRMASLLPLIKVPKDRHGDGPVPRRAGTIRPVHSHRHLQSSHLTNCEIWAQDKKRQRTTNRRTGRKGAQNTKKTMPGEREKSRSCIVPRDGTHARLRGKTDNVVHMWPKYSARRVLGGCDDRPRFFSSDRDKGWPGAQEKGGSQGLLSRTERQTRKQMH